MIPKKIHYIWIGRGKKPKNFTQIYNSWIKYAKGFQIVEWNEDTISEFDLPSYYHKSYNNKKWAFASDVLRVYILHKYGGIYLDIDEELIKSIDTKEILANETFLGKYHEVENYFGFGFIGAVQQSNFMSRLKNFYISFEGDRDVIINKIGSEIALSLKKEDTTQVTLFPQEYFYPLKETDITKNTYGKHHANTSWIPKWKKLLHKIPFYLIIKKTFLRFLPKKIRSRIQKIEY